MILPRRGRAAARLALGLALVLLCSGGPATAGGQGPRATSAEVRTLAERAETDDAALADLREIRVVDGRPVDLAAATADLGPHRRDRLAALARSFEATEPVAIDRGEARQMAEDVLAADKFQEAREPQPFRGALRWLTDRLRPVGRPFAAMWDAIAEVPGGGLVAVAVLGAVLGLCLAALLNLRSGSSVSRGASGGWLVDPELDPVDLEAQAQAAAGEGRYGAAVRLRYEAGLVRLDREGRVVLRRDTTPYGAAAQVGDPILDALTATFVDVVYGEREATAAEDHEAALGWGELLGTRVRR